MPDIDTPPRFPRNPSYGEGIFRRRIRLDGQPGKVIAEMEDTCHGFRSTVFHDGNKVTDIQAEALRTPLNTCSGATTPIKAMIGLPITTAASAFNRQVDPRANCTHLYDLTVLAISHCLRGNVLRQYDVSIDDENGQAARAIVTRNGEVAIDWLTKQWAVVEPAEHAGKPLFKGFAAWAGQAFSGDEQEAAFVLHKSYFVGQSRNYDMDKMAGKPATSDSAMLGVCYSYSAGVVENAFRSENTTRDFTDTPEQLLKFL